MRVIAGTWRGRRLQSPRGEAVRPTADRVKEALFSILGRDVTGCCFVDLCCGSGGLAIEALSRGAGRAVLVDGAGASLALARRNLELCGAEPGSYELVRAEAVRWLERWSPSPEAGWVLVADPPYRSGIAQAIMSRLAGVERRGLRAVVLEHERGLAWSGPPPADCGLVAKAYGETVLTILRPLAETATPKEGT